MNIPWKGLGSYHEKKHPKDHSMVRLFRLKKNFFPLSGMIFGGEFFKPMLSIYLREKI
jgi:hypothetical protein